MEFAIDKHLKCPRTLSRRVADDPGAVHAEVAAAGGT